MKVKKYVGDTMQDTIFKVKADLGSDAIILNTRKIKTGGFFGLFGKKQVEVLAALDDKRVGQDEESGKTLQEINELKKIVKEMNRSWQLESSLRGLSDELVFLFSHFKEQEIELEFIENFISRLKEIEIKDRQGLINLTKKRLEDYLTDSEPIKVDKQQKVVAFVGPTGVGKTTTIAKLAAHFSLDKRKKVGLITADTYRIAAVQQLQTYSEIINTPLEVVYNESELEMVIRDKFKGYDIILIDTAGSSYNNKLQLGRLKRLTRQQVVDEIHLMISMNTRSIDIKGIIDKFSTLKPDKIVLTKLDETTSFGDIINIREEYNLPYSYITFGQNVPDDISVADSSSLANYIIGDLHE